MKSTMWLCITAGGILGGMFGSLLDRGNSFGGWSLLFGTVGSLAGIWAAVKLNR